MRLQPQPIRDPIIRWLVYSHVWLALGAAAQVWWTFMHWPDRDPGSRLVLFAFSGTISAYGFMRLMRAKGDLARSVPLFSWVERNSVWQWIMVLITAVIAFGAIFPLIDRLIGILWWVVPICLLYVLPFGYPKRYFGLRAVPLLKVPLIGIVWCMITVVLPLRSADPALPDPIASLLMFRSILLIMALTIAFDIRDSKLDPPALRTIPQLLGDRGAKAVAIGMMVICMLIQLALSKIDLAYGTLMFHLFPIAGMVYATVLIGRSDRSKPEVFFGFTIDGMLILIPLLAQLGGMF